jgi:2-dehydro-3-deoxyphosphogluconate aldolase/(4S)-4-hydroxy-2-oxoglutarate aldolase
MKNTEQIINIIKEQGIIPLFYHDDVDVSIAVVNALYNAGIRVVEYTNRGSRSIDNFKALIEMRNKRWSDLILSVGTIKNIEAANQFIDAGTDFIICPGTIQEVAKATQDVGLLWVPGCMTPTEIIIAEQHGAKLVKLFPGSLLGPSYVSAIKELFPGILFMPTGGVDTTEDNLRAWFKAGVCAVGMGSKLVSKELLASKDYAAIESSAKKVLQLIKQIKE